VPEAAEKLFGYAVTPVGKVAYAEASVRSAVLICTPTLG
jgi:hypothetical protein